MMPEGVTAAEVGGIGGGGGGGGGGKGPMHASPYAPAPEQSPYDAIARGAGMHNASSASKPIICTQVQEIPKS